MTRAWSSALCLWALVGPGVEAHGGDLPIVTTDLLQIRTVTAIDVAPDGSKAVFAVRSVAEDEPEGNADHPVYTYRSHLFLLDLIDAEAPPRQLTFGDRADTDPHFSPDGRRLAFTRSRGDGEDEGQVWVMRVDGGEARMLTSLAQGAAGGSGRWSPDGRHLLVRSMLPMDQIDGVPPYPTERPNRQWNGAETTDEHDARPDGTRQEIRRWLQANESRRDPSLIARLDFQDEQELRDAMRFGHLFLVDPDDPAMAAKRITRGFFDHGDPSFMPDGKSVVYTARKRADEHPDRVLGTDIWRINVDGSGDQRLVGLAGWSLETPRPNRDGSLIALIGYQLDEPAFRQARLGIAAAAGDPDAEPTWLTGPGILDSSVDEFAWVPGRVGLLFTTARHGAFPLMNVSQGLLEPVSLLGDLPVGVHAFDVGGAATVYSMTSPVNPSVLMARTGRDQRMAYDLNPWVQERRLSEPAEGWLVRPDGVRVQYWLMEPTDRKSNQRYPLVVAIHGGPSAMWGPGELTMWHEFQLLCSWGYGVVFANPRGSGGYGYEFQRLNFQDWGEGPAGDVLAVVDHVAARHDWIDEDRLVVTGGSYAGYLTAWIVAHDHRFKAAVAQRGVYDIATFFGEGNAWRLVEWSMGGFPFDQRYRAIIDRNSPFTYVSRIRTPLLIMHANQDLRTGVSQSEMLYRALKARGQPVEYVRYPGAGHDLSRTGDPYQRMDRLNRIIEFFERHLENPRPAPRLPQAE